MSTLPCPQCNGSGAVRRGGFDHSGQVEWVEKCPNGCSSPKQAPQTVFGFIGEVVSIIVGILVVGSLVLACWK